jgi:hypothetical protein
MAPEGHPDVRPRQTASRRILRSIGLSLAAGTVLTIAIAWASAVASTLHRSTSRGGPDLQVGSSVITHADRSKSSLTVTTSSTWLASSARLSLSPWKADPITAADDAGSAEEFLTSWSRGPHGAMSAAAAAEPTLNLRTVISAYGWPARCVRTIHRNQWRTGGTQNASTTGEFPLPAGIQSFLTGGTPPVTLPIDVWWPGLALDIVFWSVLARAAVAVGAAGRRRFRRRRGLCPSCGYSLLGLSDTSVCPECGRPAALGR